MKQTKRYKRFCRTAAALSGIAASFSMVLYPSAVHVFAEESEAVVIPVSQVFSATGYGADTADGSFSYELASDKAGTPLPESTDAGSNESSYVFSLQKETSRDISVSYTQAGEYHYTLSCTTKDGNGYRVDPRGYTVDVYILPAGDGGVRLGGMYIKDSEGNKKTGAEFSHSYDGGKGTSSDPVIATDPPVRKTVKGSPEKESEFCFSLQAKDAGQPMPEGSESGRKLLYITGEGEAEFGDWTYSEPGTYVYDIAEVDTGEEGYVFDNTVYTITDTVTRTGKTLDIARSITTADGENYTQDTVDFVNEYKGGGQPGGTDERPTTKPAGGSDDDGGSSSDSSRKSRLPGRDTGDVGNILPFIAIPASLGGILTALVLGIRKSKKAER